MSEPLTAIAPERPVVRARNLGFRRGERWIFRKLDLDVLPGDFIALVGPSGVGKTTLLSCLCGLLQPHEGTIEICLPGQSPRPPHSLRHQMGIIFQSLSLIPNADLLTNVQCGRLARYCTWRTLLGFPRAHRAEAYALLADLGVGADPYKWVSEVSGGEQQRVAIARALYQSPALYFADEPVSNLDTYYAGRVLGLLRQEADTAKRTVFCVLHDPGLINKWANQALSLQPDDPTAWRLRRIRGGASAPSVSTTGGPQK